MNKSDEFIRLENIQGKKKKLFRKFYQCVALNTRHFYLFNVKGTPLNLIDFPQNFHLIHFFSTSFVVFREFELLNEK